MTAQILPPHAAPCPTTGLAEHFCHPRGWIGSIVGHLMALKNRRRSLWVLERLDPQPGEQVLELGFGGGTDIKRVAGRAQRVAGVGHSAAMVRQAAARNREAVSRGIVDLQQAAADDLPFAAEAFDKVFSINLAQFWRNPGHVYAELHRVLRPGGQLWLAVQPRSAGASAEDSKRIANRLADGLVRSRFEAVSVELSRAVRPVPVALVRAMKPSPAAPGYTPFGW